VRRLALAVLLTSASLFVCPQPARGAWGAKPPSSKEARHSLAVSVAPVPERSSPQDASVPVRPSPQDAPVPFKAPSQVPLDFRGPGREEPEPDVDEVVLGWFGPGDPDHPDFGDLWRGATLALEQENAAGGYRGKPVRLLPAWSESPWKAGIVDLTRLVYDRHAWAVIGGVDGMTTHLAVQIALKSHFLLLSPGSTDVSTDRANVPWLFSLPPSDERIATLLADAISQAAAGGSFAVAASTDHDSHAALVALRRALGARRLTPVVLVEVTPSHDDLTAMTRRLLRGSPRVVVVLAPSTAAGRLVVALREAGYGGTIVSGAPAARAAFRRAASAAAEGAIVPLLTGPGPAWQAFALSYERRWGEPPDEAAAHGYDAVRLLAAAVREAGLNRMRIRDAIRALAPWPGASGTVSWNALGRNERAMALGSWNDGRLRVVRRP
jgi:branched-chain amino acid transport system substrate-binding protein